MKSFSIDRENNITAFATVPEAQAASGEAFGSEAELHKLTADWPTSRLVEIWNSIPGFTPVQKFTDRKTAVGRIWKAIQSLDGGVELPAANVPAKAAPGKRATLAQKGSHAARKGPQARQSAQAKKPARKPPTSAREGSKTAKVLAMLQQSQGATLQQLTRATGWQAHSVRGFISATLGKRMGLTVTSTKRDDGERIYSIQAAGAGAPRAMRRNASRT
jgi:hypothetical protein